jgi:hypothetical protein
MTEPFYNQSPEVSSIDVNEQAVYDHAFEDITGEENYAVDANPALEDEHIRIAKENQAREDAAESLIGAELVNTVYGIGVDVTDTRHDAESRGIGHLHREPTILDDTPEEEAWKIPA